MPISSVTARRLLTSVLALALAPIGAGAADERLGDDVAPTFQAVELELDPARSDYRGTVRIELEVKRETGGFRLHSEGLGIERVALSGSGGAVAVHHRPEGEDQVRFEAETPLEPGAYTLEIAFANAYDTRAVSLYRTEVDGQGYLFSQFQADDAREAFPCFDEPAFKIPFQLTLTVPEAHLAVTNTPVEGETVADGRRTVRFRKTPPLPSYLLAIAAGPFETVELPGLGVPGRIVTVRGQSHLTRLAVETTPPLLAALERYFGRSYPYAKLDFLAVPEFWPGAMENPGAVTYADRILLLAPETASVSQRRTLAQVIAHELAHMWFGDLVTLEWWDDLWLNESFATWMGDKVAHEVFPQYGTAVAAVERTQIVLGQDARAATRAIRRPVASAKDLLDGLSLTYQKGLAVLAMFEKLLGPETFRRGVRRYVEEHAWGNATAADLWKALDQASGKPVSAAMATFIDQPGFPLIGVEPLGEGRVTLTQQRFRNHGGSAPDLTWRVPVALKYPAGDGVAETTVLLDTASRMVDLETEGRPAWIFPNADADGYYRWRLPAEPLRALATKASSSLTPRERVELIGNASALLAAGALRGDRLLEILGELAGDPDPLVIRALLGALDALKVAVVPADVEEAFAGYVRRTLGAALERFGMEKAASEPEAVSLVRPRLYAWLGREGRDESVLRAARSLAASYLEDPTSIDPSLAGVALRLTALEGDRQRFDDYRRRLESAKSPAERRLYLAALGAFGTPELKRAALAYALEGPLRPNEIFTPIRTLAQDDEAGRELAYRWLTESYGPLMERIPPTFAAFMPFFASGCSMERLEHAKTFFSEPGRGGPAVARQLEEVAEQVADCVALREREGEAVARYLKQTS